MNAPDLPLCIKVYRANDTAVVVRVTGELDTLTAPAVDAQLTAAQAELTAPAAVVLDLSGLRFMSSAGLALLATHHERCAEQGNRLLVVTGGNRSVLRPVSITGLDTMLHLAATVSDATGATDATGEKH